MPPLDCVVTVIKLEGKCGVCGYLCVPNRTALARHARENEKAKFENVNEKEFTVKHGVSLTTNSTAADSQGSSDQEDTELPPKSDKSSGIALMETMVV